MISACIDLSGVLSFQCIDVDLASFRRMVISIGRTSDRGEQNPFMDGSLCCRVRLTSGPPIAPLPIHRHTASHTCAAAIEMQASRLGGSVS